MNNQATQDVDSAGGAISVFGKSQLTVKGSEFTNNEGFAGGAITTVFTPLTIEDSVFRNNESRSWGGAVNNDGASVPNQERYYNGDLPRDSVGGETIIRNSIFEDNTAVGLGGGVAIWGYDQDFVTIEGSTFINNEVTPNAQGNAQGGGLRVTGKLVTIENSTIANNTSAQEGGGLWYWEESPFNIINTTFSGNEAAERGGAIYNAQWGSETNIVNTTFANNSAGSESGAIYTANTRPVTVTNSIFDSNTAGDGSNPNQQTNRELTGGNNLQSPESGNNVTENITIVDPLLGALQDINGVFVHPLLPGSPAIDAGTSVGAPGTDQTGAVRPQDGDLNGDALIDIGAYESPGTLLTPEIQVLDGATGIVDGTTAALDFGNTLVGTPLVKTFTLTNSGTAALNLSELQLPTGFSLVGTLPTSVAAGAETALTIQLDAAAVGTSTGEIAFATNDSDENPFNFAISGSVTATATSPEIQLLDGLVNSGTAALNLGELQLPTGFSFVGTLPTSVAAGGETALTIQLDATAVGTSTGEISFATNDSDENPFNFAISGSVTTATSSEIQVLDGNTDIVDGSTVALDFGSSSVGSTLTKTFSIQNLGTAILTLEAPGLPEGFSIVGDFPSTVAAGDSASFTLALDTTIAGTYSGTVTFGNNDSDESPFDFTISGTVDSPLVSTQSTAVISPKPWLALLKMTGIEGLGGQDILSGDLGMTRFSVVQDTIAFGVVVVMTYFTGVKVTTNSMAEQIRTASGVKLVMISSAATWVMTGLMVAWAMTP
jgi:predicted outer membrane repeat protein